MNDETREQLPERSPVMPGAARAGVVAGAGMVAVLGAAIALGAAAPAGSTIATTAATTGVGSTANEALTTSTGWLAPTAADGAFGHLRGGHGFGEITITAISGSSVSLQTANGWTRTVTVGDDVTITKGGQEIALGDLEVGDEIRLGERRNDDGTFTLERIAVVVPTVAGMVSAVDADSITVQSRNGLSREITTTEATTYSLGMSPTTRSELTVGDRIVAFGEAGADDSFTATRIAIGLPRVAGEVTATSASGFTLRLRDGTSVTVTVDGDTEYRFRGVENPGLDDIEVGDRVGVLGTQDGSTIDAQVVGGGRGLGRGGHGPGRDWFGGGRGWFGGGTDEAPADGGSNDSSGSS